MCMKYHTQRERLVAYCTQGWSTEDGQGLIFFKSKGLMLYFFRRGYGSGGTSLGKAGGGYCDVEKKITTWG